MRQHLSGTHKTRARANRTPVYGIVTVGRYVRVYKYSDMDKAIVAWAPHGVRKGVRLDLRDKKYQPKTTKILNHIRDH